ncbi:MAG TPA: endonuclease [Flavobacteriaceae bacterium]
MKKIALIIAFIFSVQFIAAQLVINELDCDTSIPGDNIDNHEFLEILSETPNFTLDGYVVVFFNGSISGGNTSYFTIDLDGYSTDVNGLLLIGSNSVSPVPQYLISTNVIQNGADAVAIYQASWDDFPDGTLAYVDETLVDVLLYRTTQTDGTGLIPIFSSFNPDIQIISEGSGNNTNSIQRNNDGTYFVGVPTPRQLNDGSGVVLNGISIAIAQTQYTEGDSFDITFTTEQNVNEDLNFDITLNNQTFDTSDFTGNTNLTIPSGQNTTATTISLIDDPDDEGDEVMKISFGSLPAQYLELNNNLDIRAVDNDFTTAAWGTPINPTYGLVSSAQPNNYYDSLDGLSGATLRQALQDIIADPNVVRAQTYADVIDILKEADQNPENSNQVWLVYLEIGRAKLDFQTTSNNLGTWNREHTFPRSRAGYFSIDADDIADGKDIFWTTEADSLRHGNSDAHGLRASDGPENSIRGNQFYGEYTGPIGTLGGFKGDVARSVFYLVARYNGLEIVIGFPDGLTGQFGDLATLLDWHRNDPPDDYEMNRNNVVYTWQFNRNPFIDEPDLVEYIWGNMVGQIWDQSLGSEDFSASEILVFPNPTTGRIYFKGIQNEAEIEVFTIDGRKLSSIHLGSNTYLDLKLSSGLYLVRISSEGKSIIKKIAVK